MNKYKLVNTATKEEHICEKVVVGGFDYYICNESAKDDFFVYNSKYNEVFKIQTKKYPLAKILDFDLWNSIYKKVIATNNHDRNFKEIPKVIDEVHVLALKNADKEDWDFQSQEGCGYYDHVEGFKNGYDESQLTHPFSEENVYDIIDFIARNPKTKAMFKGDILKLWKSEQIKTIYYE